MTTDQPHPPEEVSLIALAEQNPMLGFALGAIGLALLALVAYLPVANGEYVWMDNHSVTENPSLHSVDGLQRFWVAADGAGRYQPLTMTSYWLDFQAWKLKASAYHLTNILLNVLVALSLWVLLRRLDVPGAWACAAAVALHPTHVQAVAWISGRGIVLASIFYFCAMLVYLRYAGLTPTVAGSTAALSLPDDPGRLWGISFFLFLCAMLCDPVAVTLPFAMLLVIWWKRGHLDRAVLVPLVPFVVAGGLGAAAAVWMQAKAPAVSIVTAAMGEVSILNRLIDGGREIGFYAFKILMPIDLMFDYPRWQLSAAIGLVAWAIVAAILLGLWIRRDKIGRSPFVAMMLFVLLLIPTMGLLDPPAWRYSFVADRLAFLASVPLIVLVVSSLVRVIQLPRMQEAVSPTAVPVSIGLLLAVLFVMTFHRASLFATNRDLWPDTLRKNPNSLLGADSYGSFLLENRDVSDAQKWFEKANRVAPGDPVALYSLGTIAKARAYEERQKKNLEQAAVYESNADEYFRNSVKVDPLFARGHMAIGDALGVRKDHAGAAAEFALAMQADPDLLSARLQYGAALRRQAELEKDEAKRKALLAQAQDALMELVYLAPASSPAHTELGTVYLNEGNVQAELDEYRIAVKLDPANTSVFLNYGAQLDSSGASELAQQQFYAATKVDPNLPAAHFYLGRIQLKLGHRADAVASLLRAVDLDDSNGAAKELLARAQSELKTKGPGSPMIPAAASEPVLLPRLNSAS